MSKMLNKRHQITLGFSLKVAIIGIVTMIAFAFPFSARSAPPTQSISPYGNSAVITDIVWDTNSHVHEAPGSDLWPVTWGSDGNIYASWGDGGGFGGTNNNGRVSAGIARIEDGPVGYTTANVNGGINPENTATWGCSSCGKMPGIISVDGTLYGWVNIQDGGFPDFTFKLYWSSDLGATWQQSSWEFPNGNGNFKPHAFLNFGQDNSGSRDNYVYFYGLNEGQPSNIKDLYLGRVLKTQLTNRNSYEFLSGFDGNGDPTWSSDVNDRSSVFNDSDGAWIPSVTYNAPLDRYLLTTTHDDGLGGRLGIFDAPEPWGPWTTVAYYDNWIGAGGGEGLVYNFANKWTSPDGLTMWMVFSCFGCDSPYSDRFNLIKATLSTNVSQVNCPTLPGVGVQSQDLDSDAKCEDINGNNAIDFNDIVEFFQYLSTLPGQNLDELDFNNNSIEDMDDVVELFNILVAART